VYGNGRAHTEVENVDDPKREEGLVHKVHDLNIPMGQVISHLVPYFLAVSEDGDHTTNSTVRSPRGWLATLIVHRSMFSFTHSCKFRFGLPWNLSSSVMSFAISDSIIGS
jgi:hypothetical protein